MQPTSLAALLFVELSGFHDLLERNEAAAIALLGPWRSAAGISTTSSTPTTISTTRAATSR